MTNRACALERGDFAAASPALEQNPGLLFATNGIGESVLHFLAVENNQPGVKWLHGRGADLNAANAFGSPLLFEAALLGHRDLFLWLVDHGADPAKQDAQGQSIGEYLTDFEEFEMIEFIQNHLTL